MVAWRGSLKLQPEVTWLSRDSTKVDQSIGGGYFEEKSSNPVLPAFPVRAAPAMEGSGAVSMWFDCVKVIAFLCRERENATTFRINAI